MTNVETVANKDQRQLRRLFRYNELFSNMSRVTANSSLLSLYGYQCERSIYGLKIRLVANRERSENDTRRSFLTKQTCGKLPLDS